MQIDIEEFQKHIDEETGAIVFYKKGFKGIPDRVIQGDGFTIEIKDEEVVIFDIYNPQLVLSKLAKEVVQEVA
ncbi:MAG: hypothetical protein HY096_02705 [Nitrospinae bacterium]|nr:hypothetical protein [Nitrospinota bacterium]